ncbi:MAG: M23 family metallopeptidase [Leptolyngbyaceae cyanobacterium]
MKSNSSPATQPDLKANLNATLSANGSAIMAHVASNATSKAALSVLLVGGLSMVGVGMADRAIASADSSTSVPSAHDLLEPVIKSQPLPPAPAPIPSSPAIAPVAPPPAPVIVAPPSPPAPSIVTPVAPASAPPTNAPTPDVPTVEFSAPAPSVPTTAPLATPPILPSPTPSLDLSPIRGNIPVTDINYGNSYLDTTDYSLGATPSPGMVPDIVFSERSTGCQTVLQQGQAISSSSFCGRVTSSNVASGLIPLRTGNNTTLGSPLAGPFAGPLPQVNEVAIGPLSISSSGLVVTRRLSIQDYYNRTEQPKALPGNNNANLLFPLSIPAMVSSPFGMRVHPIFGNVRMHTGTDLAAPMGTPVVAAYSGRVAVSDFMGGYGLAVVIGHSEKSAETLYGHLSEVFVKAGEWVEQGTVIGRVGSTGNSTGPHLHFELRQQTTNGWVAVNSGSLLQQGLTNVHAGFQLGDSFSIADASLINPTNGELEKLSIPTVLQYGKNATKENISDTLASSDGLTLDLLEDKASSSDLTPNLTIQESNPQPSPEPGAWVSPHDLVSDGKE